MVVVRCPAIADVYFDRTGKRVLSSEARERIAEAQRRRWAAAKGETPSPVPAPAKRKRKLSAAGRAHALVAVAAADVRVVTETAVFNRKDQQRGVALGILTIGCEASTHMHTKALGQDRGGVAEGCVVRDQQERAAGANPIANGAAFGRTEAGAIVDHTLQSIGDASINEGSGVASTATAPLPK